MTDYPDIIDRLLRDGWERLHLTNGLGCYTLSGRHPLYRDGVSLCIQRETFVGAVLAFRDAAQAAELAYTNEVLQREG